MFVFPNKPPEVLVFVVLPKRPPEAGFAALLPNSPPEVLVLVVLPKRLPPVFAVLVFVLPKSPPGLELLFPNRLLQWYQISVKMIYNLAG